MWHWFRWRGGTDGDDEPEAGCAQRYRAVFDRLREQLGYVDYLGALHPSAVAARPAADFTIEHIGELADVDLSPLITRPADEASATRNS